MINILNHIFLGFLTIISLFFVTDGILCYINYDWCPSMPYFEEKDNLKNIGIPMIIMGIATLIPNLFAVIKLPVPLEKQSEYQPLHETNEHKKKYLSLLYTSYFMSSWGDRMWQFTIPVILMVIFKNTFLPTTIYFISIYLGNIFTLQYIGKWIDKTNKFKVQKIAIIIENLSIISSSIILSLIPYLFDINNIDVNNYLTIIIIVLVILFGIIGEVMNNAQTISTEKDWVIIISEEINMDINDINKIFIRIDLACKIIAPGVVGFIIDLFENSNQKIFIIGLTIGIWNFMSFPLELILKKLVYDKFTELNKEHDYFLINQNECLNLDFIKLYFNHFIIMVSISMALLYMTVLSNGPLMTNYLQWRNVSLTIIGLSRGLGAFMGFLGTFLFSCIMKRAKEEDKTGLISIWGFFILLLPILFSFIFLKEDRITDYILIGCCIISRAMLWIFELCVQKIMQVEIEDRNRGKINSMHAIMLQIFSCLIFIFGLIFHNPQNFIYLVIISTLSIGISSIVYSIWYKNYNNPYVNDLIL
jgi:solute carrier family 40 (iron-regulated transporter), member 1